MLKAENAKKNSAFGMYNSVVTVMKKHNLAGGIQKTFTPK